jgi:hypothetical protein
MSLNLGRLRPYLLFLALVALVAAAATLPRALAPAAHGATQPANGQVDRAAAAAGSRPFRPTSYWNTRLGPAPHSPHSSQWIKDAKKYGGHGLNLIIGDWGMPVYRSKASDPVYRFSSNGHSVRVHIPRQARPMNASDAALTVIDRSTNQVVGSAPTTPTGTGALRRCRATATSPTASPAGSRVVARPTSDTVASPPRSLP